MSAVKGPDGNAEGKKPSPTKRKRETASRISDSVQPIQSDESRLAQDSADPLSLRRHACNE
jgi:hypothetical protein